MRPIFKILVNGVCLMSLWQKYYTFANAL